MANEYFYPKNKHYYDVIEEVRCKDRITGKWYDAVLYTDGKGTYVREKNDFYNKFIRQQLWQEKLKA